MGLSLVWSLALLEHGISNGASKLLCSTASLERFFPPSNLLQRLEPELCLYEVSKLYTSPPASASVASAPVGHCVRVWKVV